MPAVTTLARTYHDLHRYHEAVATYDQALALAPTNLSVVQGKVRTLLSRGDLEGARRVIRAALERVDAKSVIIRFATYEEMMWVLPEDLRARVVELQPKDFDNDRGMWALKVGATYRLMGDVARARNTGQRLRPHTSRWQRVMQTIRSNKSSSVRALALAGQCARAVPAGERHCQ